MSHTELSILCLLHCQDEAKHKLEEQHLVFHLGSSQTNHISILLSTLVPSLIPFSPPYPQLHIILL